MGEAKPKERHIKLLLINRSVGERTYFLLELVVLVVQLGLADAAYSGDWSRIGVITHELELQLQLLVNFIICAHALVGVAAAVVAQQKGLNPGLAGVKGFVFGAMALYDTWQQERQPEAPSM